MADPYKFKRWRDTPHGKAVRKEIADWYRNMRKLNPAAARFLFRENHRVTDAILYGGPYK